LSIFHLSAQGAVKMPVTLTHPGSMKNDKSSMLNELLGTTNTTNTSSLAHFPAFLGSGTL